MCVLLFRRYILLFRCDEVLLGNWFATFRTIMLSHFHWFSYFIIVDRDCSVGIANSLRGTIRGSNPVRGEYSAAAQTIPGVRQTSYKIGRVQLKCDGTRRLTGVEVKGKLANGVGSQYSSHYLGTWCIQHYYR